jgi:hypothetical protein
MRLMANHQRAKERHSLFYFEVYQISMRPSVLGVCSNKGNSMALTVLMFFVLIASYALMFGLVKFAENVIAKTQYGPPDNGAAARTGDTTNPL